MSGRARFFSLLAAIALCGCERSPCESVCSREANCSLAASQGERMMGEGKLPPDKACLRRCAERHDDFMKCEGIKGDCTELLACPRW